MESQFDVRFSSYCSCRILRRIVAAVSFAIVLVSPVAAHEFATYCQAALGRTEALLVECKKNAWSLSRNFMSGKYLIDREEHRVWIAPWESGSHLGLGCVLDKRGEVRFMGIYFILDPDNHLLMTESNLSFADFGGNIGFRATSGKSFGLLAVHSLVISGGAY